MRWIVIAVVCVGFAAPAAAQDAKAKGAQLFADQKCTLCHSIGDKGNKKGPLDDVGSKLSAAADVASQQQNEVGDLIGSGAQAELGVARRGLFDVRLR